MVFRTPVNSWFRQASPTDDSDNDNDKEMMSDITTSDRFASRRSWYCCAHVWQTRFQLTSYIAIYNGVQWRTQGRKRGWGFWKGVASSLPTSYRSGWSLWSAPLGSAQVFRLYVECREWRPLLHSRGFLHCHWGALTPSNPPLVPHWLVSASYAKFCGMCWLICVCVRLWIETLKNG